MFAEAYIRIQCLHAADDRNIQWQQFPSQHMQPSFQQIWRDPLKLPGSWTRITSTVDPKCLLRAFKHATGNMRHAWLDCPSYFSTHCSLEVLEDMDFAELIGTSWRNDHLGLMETPVNA